MHLSNILTEEEAKTRVLEFVPPNFRLATPEQAVQYLHEKEHGNPFRMDETIRIQTGVKGIESENFEEKIEQRVIEKLQSIQEGAYQEAYQLGLAEGRKEAFKKNDEEINKRLTLFDEVISKISILKTELGNFNEAHIVQLAFHMAKRLAYAEITADPELIKTVLKQALETAQSEEEVTVQVSPTQFEFLESLKKETGREFEFMKKVKLVPAEGITPGGCVIETNYGVIDASFEQRVQKLWEGIAENLHRVKAKISAA